MNGYTSIEMISEANYGGLGVMDGSVLHSVGLTSTSSMTEAEFS